MPTPPISSLSGPSDRRRNVGWVQRDRRSDLKIGLALGIGLVISYVPVVLMLNISGKNPGQFLTDPLSITLPSSLDNYIVAFNVLWRPLLNTLGMSVVVVILSLTTSTLAGYVFARHKFRGSEVLFWFYIAVLFVPDVLTIVPRYNLSNALGMLDTYWVQILPYVATTQIFQTVVMRAFISGISRDLFEAAAIDGASTIQSLRYIAIPLCRPILATLAVLRAIGFWDEWVWPSVTVASYDVRPMALQVLYLQSDLGSNVGQQMAGYVIASIPLLVLFLVASKQFVEGLTSGAVKL